MYLLTSIISNQARRVTGLWFTDVNERREVQAAIRSVIDELLPEEERMIPKEVFKRRRKLSDDLLGEVAGECSNSSSSSSSRSSSSDGRSSSNKRKLGNTRVESHQVKTRNKRAFLFEKKNELQAPNKKTSSGNRASKKANSLVKSLSVQNVPWKDANEQQSSQPTNALNAVSFC